MINIEKLHDILKDNNNHELYKSTIQGAVNFILANGIPNTPVTTLNMLQKLDIINLNPSGEVNGSTDSSNILKSDLPTFVEREVSTLTNDMNSLKTVLMNILSSVQLNDKAGEQVVPVIDHKIFNHFYKELKEFNTKIVTKDDLLVEYKEILNIFTVEKKAALINILTSRLNLSSDILIKYDDIYLIKLATTLNINIDEL